MLAAHAYRHAVVGCVSCHHGEMSRDVMQARVYGTHEGCVDGDYAVRANELWALLFYSFRRDTLWYLTGAGSN